MPVFRRDERNSMHNAISINSSGQESAPFELLIAVIVMTFVIFVGMNALTKLNEEQCNYKIQKGLQDFKFALEKTTNQAIPLKKGINIPPCFKDQEIYLQYMESKSICTDICQVEKERCILLTFDSDTSNFRYCINIQIATLFQGDECIPSGEEGEPVDLQTFSIAAHNEEKVSLKSGTYVFQNNSKAGDPFPTICVYRVK